MSDAIPVAQLRAFVERIEHIEADIKELNLDKSEVYKELRGCGFDVKAVRAVVAKRKLDTADREERDAMFDLYWSALNGEDRARAHAREIIEEFDAETGEITDNQDSQGGNGPLIAVETATEKQDAGTSRPSNSNSPDTLPVEADKATGAVSSSPAPVASPSDPYDPGDIPAFLRRTEGRLPKHETAEA